LTKKDERLVFGVGPVREVLASRPDDVERLVLSFTRAARARHGRKPDPLSRLAATARERGIDVEEKPQAVLDRMAGPKIRHQGAIAVVVGRYAYAELDDVLAVAQARGEAPLIVALDQVTDPHNLGAVIRSAHVLGAHGVVMPQDRSAEVTPAAVKASAGATEHMAVARVKNLVRALEDFKERGLWNVAVTAGPDSRPLWEIDATMPLCLVLGSEGKGIRPLVLRQCDFRGAIPMRGQGVGSLNVSVAAGVALYEVARRR
jgi:23S rRNA (guanosine2251-2'-O)-methyltransferase